jgi:hypothetical protein
MTVLVWLGGRGYAYDECYSYNHIDPNKGDYETIM